MESLRDHTKRISRELDIEGALSSLGKFGFDAKLPTRLISGVAISSSKPNVNDDAFWAKGMMCQLPTVLLWNHQWERPLGRVVEIATRGNQVRFRAEIANAMPWVQQIWQAIIDKRCVMVSIEALALCNPVDRTYTRWQLSEVSVVQIGADAGAVINRYWERFPYVSLNRPNETVHWSSL